jgi:hypothetical protein
VDVTSGNVTLTTANGTTDQARNMFIRAFGASAARDVIVPAVTKLYFVVNDCTADVTFKVSAQTGVAVPAGKTAVLRCDGTDIVPAVTYLTELTTGGDLSFDGTAQRITGDFSNATLADRVAFQTGTTNGNTNIHALTNGTGTTSSFQANNSSDLSNGSQVYITAGASEAQLVSDKTGTGTYLPLTFYTGGSERMRINTVGDVSFTGDLFLANGNALAWGTGDGSTRIEGDSSTEVMAFFTSGSEQIRIGASGNVLVGTATANARLTVSGSVSWTTGTSFAGASGDAVWTTSFGSQAINASIQASDSIAGANIYAISDVRLKNNIRPIPSGLAFVNEVDAVQFTWKESGIEDTGFIAQDLLKKGFGHLVSAIPDGAMQELVHEDGNVSPAGSRFVVKYDSVVPILCKAIQEQQAVIEDLRARVAELESK